MAEVKQDQAHHRRVLAMLDVLVADGADLAHALLACESAYVELGMGLTCGLPSVAAVLEQHRAALAALVQCEDASRVPECGKNASGEQCH